MREEPYTDEQRLDYMDDAFNAAQIRAGANDDGEWGYIIHVNGEDRWYAKFRPVINALLDEENDKASA